MIGSKFIADILDLLLDGEAAVLRPQIWYLSDIEYEYTGGGVFVGFSHSEEALLYKSRNESLILDGVGIETTEYPIAGDATLFFKNGVADFLEIWCYYGEYPTQDLQRYTLKQLWKDAPGRIISTE